MTLKKICIVGTGSGKLTFVKNNFSNYTILSGDELKTEAKIIKEINKNIGESSIVIDATNPSKDKRKKFIDIANSYNIPVRCIYMNVSKEQALLQNNKRDKPVPAIVFNIFNKLTSSGYIWYIFYILYCDNCYFTNTTFNFR